LRRTSHQSDAARWWHFEPGALVAIEYGFTIRGVSALTRSTFGIFAIPVALTLVGVGGDVTYAYGLFSLMSGLSAPLSGYLIDQFGIRRMQRFGALLLITGLLLCASASASWHYLIGLGILCGIGVTAFTQIPVNLLIARFVQKRRMPAFGIVTAGAGVGALLAVPLTERLISGLGWRPAYVGYAVIVMFVWIPFDLWLGRALPRVEARTRKNIVHSPPRRRPDPPPEQSTTQARPPRKSPLTRSEIQLVSAALFSGAQRTLVVAFMVPWLLDRGYGSLVAAQAFGLSEGLRAFSGVGVSMLGNRFGSKVTYVTASLVAVLSIVGLLVWADGGTALLYVTAAAYGIASGGIHPASSSLQSTIYRAERLGVLFGSSAASYGLGGAVSVIVANWTRHHFGGLDAVMALIAFGLLMMSLLVVGVRDSARDSEGARPPG